MAVSWVYVLVAAVLGLLAHRRVSLSLARSCMCTALATTYQGVALVAIHMLARMHGFPLQLTYAPTSSWPMVLGLRPTVLCKLYVTCQERQLKPLCWVHQHPQLQMKTVLMACLEVNPSQQRRCH
jgi:hypothetical protein